MPSVIFLHSASNFWHQKLEAKHKKIVFGPLQASKLGDQKFQDMPSVIFLRSTSNFWHRKLEAKHKKLPWPLYELQSLELKSSNKFQVQKTLPWPLLELSSSKRGQCKKLCPKHPTFDIESWIPNTKNFASTSLKTSELGAQELQ
jgi:hypothetical protein